jgi:hypothetical protein
MPEGTLAYITPVGSGPVDPGFGHPGSPGHPGNALPPGFPPIGVTLPEPPPGVWPPLTGWAPIQPAHPIAGVPVPPGAIWPPPGHVSGGPIYPGGHPDQGLPPAPGRPAQPLPTPPARPDQGLPGSGARPDHGLPSQTYWLVAGIPGVGWRYVAVDPSLVVGTPLPPTPEPKA